MDGPQMDYGLVITRVNKDDGFDNFQIRVADEDLSLILRVYIGHAVWGRLASELSSFAAAGIGGSKQFELGSFEFNAAGGAIRVELLLQANGSILLRASAQGASFSYGSELVRSSGTAYLLSDLASLDTFIAQLLELGNNTSETARFSGASYVR